MYVNGYILHIHEKVFECVGSCLVLLQRNVTMCYFGDQCQCDHLTSCGGISEEGELCSGLPPY